MTHRESWRVPTALVLAVGLALFAAIGIGQAADEAKVPVEVFELDNGMKFLLVPRADKTTVATGWVAHVGSANERPGITGLSHLFEHMLFKGTHTIGTTDIKRDLEIIEEQEQIQEQIRAIYREQRSRARRGEIDDPFDPENRTARQIELEEEFKLLVEEQRSIMIKDEFDKIYTKSGATGMNAGTTEDITLYFITVPANKLELWFWMESDRLTHPVFREFYSERNVVHEERRLRTESTPTGEFDEQFESMFWQSHPYNWPVVGWPSDLRVISKQQADDYFQTYYAANNLTAVLVGNFDVDEVKKLATRYFGRLPKRSSPAPDVVTLEMEQKAEKRMQAECDCQPQVEVRYHTVPFMHADSYALDVLAGLLNGRTGRLYKSLVLDSEIAASARSGQDSRKYGGSFSFSAQTKGDATPQQLEEGWYTQLAKIIDEPIPAEELQKVKNGIAADAYRRLESPFFLALQLMFFDGLGDWEFLNKSSDLTLAVTVEDIKRVAGKYFSSTNRAVAQYFRKAGSGGEEEFPGLSELDPQMQGPIRQQLKRLKGISDPSQLEQTLTQIEQQKSQAPPAMASAMELIESFIRARIEELRSADGGEE